jgi:hypothetical protein
MGKMIVFISVNLQQKQGSTAAKRAADAPKIELLASLQK